MIETKNIFLTLILLLILFCSCNSPSISQSDMTFKEVWGYQINLDTNTSSVADFIQIVQDWKGKTAIAFHLRKNSAIKIYDIEEGRLIDELKYRTEGPDSYPGIYDFHIHNEDSIFLNQRYLYKIFLVDSKFKLINSFNLLQENETVDPVTGIPLSGDSYMAVFGHNKIFKVIGSKFIFNGSPDRNHNTKQYFDSRSIINTLDMETGKLRNEYGFPDSMKGSAWGPLHSFLYSDYSEKTQSFYMSYAADENLYVLDSEFKVNKVFKGSPDKFSSVTPAPLSTLNNESAYLSYFNNQYIFGSVLYDKFNDLIFRIVHEPNPDYGNYFVKDPLYNPRNILILAFDTNLKKIAEMKLEQTEKVVFLDRCFIDDKGFNIAYIDLNEEDILFFKTFNLK